MFVCQVSDMLFEILRFVKEFESVPKAGSRYFQKTTRFSFSKFWFDERYHFLFLFPAYHFFSSNILIASFSNANSA